MPCRLPEDYVAALPARIVAARREKLLSMMPSGVEGGGQDGWWDGKRVDHGSGGEWHYTGNRWEAKSIPEFGGVREAGRTVIVTFSVQITAEMTGEVYQCEICNSAS